VFESYTYENIMSNLLAQAPTGVDTREGSIFYDAVSGVALRMAKLYTDLDLVFFLTQLPTTIGEELDMKASEQGLTRHAATPVSYYFVYTGETPEPGERFFLDGLYFTLRKTTVGVLFLECEEAGASHNFIQSGTPVVPVNNIDGLTSSSIGAIKEYGTDTEEDEALRSRIQSKISGPAENGNKQHYKKWCEEADDSVGLARITPLWNGPNTVKAVLINKEGLPCDADEVVPKVQQYVDPATLGYTAIVNNVEYVVGDGLGEGVANLGAHFTAVAADEVDIAVSATVELASGYSAATAKTDVENALRAYFKNLVLTTEAASDVVVRVSAVGAVLASIEGILDYSSLTINGGTSNISPGEDGVPAVGEVTLNVAV